MTDLAVKIMTCMDNGITEPSDILAMDIGKTEAEVEFIMTQIRIARGE